MMSNNTRKRALEIIADDPSVGTATSTNKENNGIIGGSRASRAQDLKRRQIQQISWGFREALAECGLVEFVASDNDTNKSGNNSSIKSATMADVGCQLDASTTPSTLRSSINALLDEMSKNGIDPNNERVLSDLTQLVANNDNNSLLRKMLLPMYRIRNRNNRNLFSQFSQPADGPLGDNANYNNNGDDGDEIIVESSSLVKVLLRVDALQSILLTALIQKLPELADAASSSDNDDDGGGCGHSNNNDDVLPRLIFSEIRWLDHIQDISALTNTFVECLTVLASSSSSCTKTRQILLHAISTLPDILNDCNALAISNRKNGDCNHDGSKSEDQQSSILATLHHLRVEDPTLLIPCLDAIGSLPLTYSQFQNVTRDALEALATVEQWGLPALTTFLMNNCPHQSGSSNNLAHEVIGEVRKLPLGRGSYYGDDDYEMMDTHANNGSNSESLMIESFSRGFSHRSDLTLILLKSIKETTPGNHLPADIWLLACAATANHHRVKVKSIFRSKANNGGFTSQLLRQSLSGNGTALSSLFSTSFRELADGLLRSSDNAACELGVTLYEILFEEFNEPMQRTDVVSSLISHVCSGVGVKEAEVDAAMRVFSCIIEKGKGGARALRTFTPFLASMLDHLHQMSTSQIRRLFLLLFACGLEENEDLTSGGLGSSSGMGGASDEIQIVIEKNLSHGQLANKRIGIIGTVAYAVTRSAQLLKQQNYMETEETDATSLPRSAAVATSPIVKDITDKIERAYSKCQPVGSILDTNLSEGSVIASSNSCGSAAAFMLDELCHAVQGGRLVHEIHDWLDEKYQQEFEDMFVGDFEEMEEDQKGSKGEKDDDGLDPHQIPTDPHDLALLNGTTTNCIGLPGEMRFTIEGADSHVYVKILPILSSFDRGSREMLIQQLCPMFRLMASLSDERYGGRGLSEIDAMLECPLLMPSIESSGMDFEELPAIKQWVVTSTYFFAACWVRELINNFIFAAADLNTPQASAITSSSQGFDCKDAQKKLVGRLKALIELEEELRFTSAHCYVFSPPGLDLLPPPTEFYEVHSPSGDIPEIDPHASNAEKKAAAAEKKKLVKRAKEKEKSKTKLFNVKKKHEDLLSTRALGALRPLEPQVCSALGFDDLSVMGGSSADGSQCLSQVQVTACGGPVITLLLNLLDKSLTEILSEKKGLAFKSGIKERNDDNPYCKSHSAATKVNSAAFISIEESSKKCFQLLESYLKSGVFASLHEHLAVVAELRCGHNSSTNDKETEQKLVSTARCLFSCTRTLFESELLTRSSSGKFYLSLILKQLARGDRGEYQNSTRRPSSAGMNKLLSYVSDNVSEIIIGAYTGDMEFAMEGVLTIQSIFECSQRVSDDSSDAKAATTIFGKKLSEVSFKLLKEHWPDETKMNKSNVGKLLSLFLEHSPNRMKSLAFLVNEVLCELPHTEKCKGPVIALPTCSSQSFGSFYTVGLSYLWKELAKLFDRDTKNPAVADKMFEVMAELIDFLQSLFDLTRKNDSLSKKAILLQQLKLGSKFIETFVAKAIPFFQVHFEQHQETIFELIRRMQQNCRQMYAIIAHGKREKDAILAKDAPRAKKVLEMFIHKVKSLLKKNRCMTAMWTKTLKARDIDGSALSDGEGDTQSESEDGEEGEERVEDDDLEEEDERDSDGSENELSDDE